jgi:midasin
MRSLIEGLLSDKPVMLVGSPGSGKSTIINNLAGALGQADRMVTLHLNEQSDVKSLLGVYASSPSAPGTFTWSPGVLLTAVQEGRWVLIENVDRAPNEIVGALLPLLENNELVIPGRTDRVRAALGFKLFSTMSTKSSRHLIGTRFWRKVEVAMPSDHELKTIISARFPSLHSDTFMSTFSTIRGRLGLASLPSTRSITSGDLFKWCRRVERLSPLADSGLNYDTIFLEGVDCLVAHVPSGPAQDEVIETIARTLHIDPNRRDHLLHARSINLALHGLNPKALSKTFSTNQHTVQLLRRILSAVKNCEPLLLVGETGTGKTTAIQQLAKSAGKKLTVVNLSQQLESSDLLGGMKPIDLRRLAMTIQEEFEQLFLISFSRKDNGQFLELLSKSIAKGQWKRACKLWKGAIQEAKKEINSNGSKPSKMPNSQKRQKLEEHQNTNGNLVASQTHHRWMKLSQDVDYLNTAISSSSDSLMVSFQEGKIVHAVRNGGWVLLDEINLAPPDTIEALSGLFNGGDDESRPSLLLSESGSAERVNAHPEFRIFAAMNPATDIGKRDLIPSIRSRFTEIFVDSPDKDINSLQHIIRTYLGDELADKNLVSNVANLYLKIQALSREQSLVDGAGTNPHFTLRSLTRSLLFARDIAHLCGIRRGLYEGIHMSFMTSLDRESEKTLTPVVVEHVFGKNANIKAELSKSLRKPVDGRTYVQYRQYWLRQGNYPAIDQSHYIITPFVRRNLDNLIRATFSTRYPILIQGPTSSGKTSMVEYLANLSGNKCVRVNNHEYTDLQEYLGTYVAGDNGQIRFHEGILVEALRNGYWLILDELNLAPSDVLEALNRLLDDNRELLIPETQEIVRPHENFMLFATQNPAGFLYGGRKPLSRALRNRFLELHFDDIPVEELCEILQRRTQIPESWCRRIVEVYQELSQVRQENRIFEQHSFATLRDLFRWALRRADSVNELATNGYMLLAERVRKDEERAAVKDIIERVMSRRGPSVRIDPDVLYARTAPQIAASSAMSQGIVWTKSMRRLFMLVSRALQNNEPVLLVGETGCGKTTVCQVLANVAGRQLYTVNAHRNTETADLIGSQRPVRNRSEVEKQLREKLLRALDISEGASPSTKMLLERFQGSSNEMPSGEIKSLRAKYLALFQWDDGPLVAAMRAGQYFLIDEISLAEDSVLERINSVLEPDRGIFLAEMGSNDAHISAAGGFQLMATMNPGGDYGKRELSPALRNRFTEIWVPPLADLSDIFEITRATLQQPGLSDPLIGFAKWFSENYNTSSMSALSVRDILTCVGFINRFSSLEAPISLLHAISMVYVDTLGANPAALLSLSSSSSLPEERAKCIQKLDTLIGIEHLQTEYQSTPDLILSDHIARIGRFELPRDSFGSDDDTFTFEAETTRRNAMRIIRALQLSKPILIEGEPGVGKTALVTSISRVVGKKLVRINLSEQTDLMDLFGSDVPVEGEAAGRFAWRDAPFLAAMKVGDWVLLDEMNLAPQSILEGLNACFDHRGEAYIAELNQTFHRHPDFRVFAAQNPHHQGGGRKGLPASFVNRFTVVYADPFTPNDISVICQRLFPDVDHSVIESIAQVIARVASEDKRFNKFGSSGAPWEVNLRDALRWLLLLSSGDDFISNANGHDLFDIVFRRRFRTEEDMLRMDNIYAAAFKSEPAERSFYHDLAPTLAQVGIALMPRTVITNHSQHPMIGLPSSHLPILEAMMVAVQQAWPVILAGPAGSGKTNLLHHLSARKGTKLVVLPMNSDIDATDLIGSFEQADASRRHITAVGQLRHALQVIGIEALKSGNVGATVSSFELLADISESSLPSILAKVKLQLQSYKLENPDSTDRLIAQCEELTKPALENSGPMFQWVDGPLVQAVERGDWLVLDNANLCSSSVLDRLNSLLEPNGTLVINENSLPNGETRIVQPHDNFRIFLTLDPIHGELSSAMRNRALELCVSMPDASTTILDLPMQSTEYNLTKVIEIANIATTCEDYDPEQWADAMIDHTGLDRIIEFAHRNPDTLCDELRIGLLDGQLSPKIVHTLEGRLKQISRPSEASTIGTFIERFCIALGEMRFRRPWFPLVVS